MSRYIDANALKVSYCKQCLKETRNEQIEVKQTPYCAIACQDFDVIDKQPTVDAVPVVRCRECIHRPKMPENYVDGFDLEFPDHKCPCQCEDGFYSWYPADDWFCADGERRTDETEGS